MMYTQGKCLVCGAWVNGMCDTAGNFIANAHTCVTVICSPYSSGYVNEGQRRMMNNTTLGDLIDWLEAQNPDLWVKDGFGSPHSDRGDYSELAFSPEDEARIGDMLQHARSAVGATFTGWKGGEFTMDRWTPVYIGQEGSCGDPITPIHFKYWELTRKESH